MRGAFRLVAAGTVFGRALATSLAALMIGAVAPAPAARAAVATTAASPTPVACSNSASANLGRDYSGQTLAFANFSRQDLRNANFEGATLQGAVFIGADLTGANFRNAKFVASGSAMRTSDFSFATLDGACFQGASFGARTYLTYASLVCTDFSGTDLSGSNAVFGTTLNLGNSNTCRTRFQGATMNCEFVAQWNQLDLTGANLGACAGQIATPGVGALGHDFSGGIYRNVVFDGLDLSGSKWTGAAVAGASFRGSTLDSATGLAGSDLTLAVFAQASLKCLDLSSASLYGTVFDRANLEEASLSGASLSPCPAPGSCVAASLRGAWLKNVDLSGAHLQNAQFNDASFYRGASSANCKNSKPASAHAATLTRTDFSDAYLFGADFSGATMRGVIFDGAVLVAANFAGATVEPEPNQTNGSFANAFLQGADLGSAVLDGVTFSGAFFDFSAHGNTLDIQLDSDHTRFAGWHAPDTPVCTRVTYGAPTTVPSNQAGLTCPDASKASASMGCGPAGPNVPATSHWNNGSDITRNDPAASYQMPATFAPQSPAICRRDLSW